MAKREEELKAREQAAIQKEKLLKKEFEDKLSIAVKKAKVEARKRAEEKLSSEFQDMQEQLKERNVQVKQFKEMELQFRME